MMWKFLQSFLSTKKLLDARYSYGVYDEYTEKAVNLYKKYGIYDEGDSKGKVGLTTWVKMGLPVKLFNNDKFLTSVVVLKNNISCKCNRRKCI